MQLLLPRWRLVPLNAFAIPSRSVLIGSPGKRRFTRFRQWCSPSTTRQATLIRQFSIHTPLFKDFKYSADQVIGKTKELKDKTIERSKKLQDQTKQFKDKTVEKSNQLKIQTKELKENIAKIIPPEVHENIYTVPNMLTFTRLVSAPIIGYLIVKGQSNLALGLFVYSSVTDFLDGYIARKYNLKSVVGSIIDPLADKALMVICTVCLAKASAIPMYIAGIILGRDILLFLGAAVIRYISLPAPKTFLRYWDFSIVSAEVRPNMISKVNTTLQMVYIGIMVIKPVFLDHVTAETAGTFLSFLQGLEWTVACTTVISGLSYVFLKNGIKIIKPKTGTKNLPKK